MMTKKKAIGRISLDEFVHLVMQKMLAGDHWALKVLRAQYLHATIKKTEITDDRFFVYYDIPKEFYIDDINFMFNDVGAMINGPVILLNLHIENGAIDYLTGINIHKKWPEEIKTYRIAYANEGKGISEKRDMEEFINQFEYGLSSIRNRRLFFID